MTGKLSRTTTPARALALAVSYPAAVFVGGEACFTGHTPGVAPSVHAEQLSGTLARVDSGTMDRTTGAGPGLPLGEAPCCATTSGRRAPGSAPAALAVAPA